MPTIFWAGDSTVKQNSVATYPQTGLGQGMSRYLRHDVRMENHAENGRSTKSFLDEGRLTPIAERIGAGDFLFIQFGHNDEKTEDPVRYADPEKAYPANLEIFVNAARDKGACPVIITPLTRYARQAPDVKWVHDRWADAARKTAERLGVALIDLTAMSEKLVDELGEEARANYYMNIPAGVYPAFPEGLRDNTHLQPLGAMVFAGLIARGLYALGGACAELLSAECVDWLRQNDAAMAEVRGQGQEERQ